MSSWWLHAILLVICVQNGGHRTTEAPNCGVRWISQCADFGGRILYRAYNECDIGNDCFSVNKSEIAAYGPGHRLRYSRDFNHDAICQNPIVHNLYKGTASAFVLHGRNIDKSDLPKQSSSHLNILFFLESPDNAGRGLHQVPQDYFNATITYRRDSRYFWPYGRFKLRTANDDASTYVTKKQLSEAIKKKDKGSLIIVSHCGTHSKREHIIRELGKFTEITIKGRCEMQLSTRKVTGSTSLITESEVNELIATHRFYIAFENSNCKDYVTEKYFNRTSQLLVPVVLSRKIYEDAGLPLHSFIAADDFDSIKELGDYLNSLRYNNSEYLKYFDWTHTFRKPNAYVSDALCRICEDIHRGEKMTINDIREYYGANQCTSASHAHRLLAGANLAQTQIKLL